MTIQSFFFVALPAAVITTVGVAYGLIHLEQTSPFAQKPSIALRVWTGDLPTADLPRVLAETTREVEAAKATKAQTQAAIQAHREAGQALTGYLEQLETRVTEKQSTQWSSLHQ